MADRGRDFDDVLDECLERLASGETVAECCASYPGHAEDLAPLLRSAAAVRQTARATPHLARARARGYERLAQALAQGTGAPVPNPTLWERLGNLLRTPVARPVLAAFAAILVVLFAAGGTTVAARSSVPGEPLYWVKTTQENISLRMQRTDMDRSEQHARLANERSDEMHTLIERGNLNEAENLIRRLRGHITQSAHYAGVVVVVNPVRDAQHDYSPPFGETPAYASEDAYGPERAAKAQPSPLNAAVGAVGPAAEGADSDWPVRVVVRSVPHRA